MLLSRRWLILVLTLSLTALVVPFANSHAASPTPQGLTNKDISDMHQSGLSADIIVAKIKAGQCNFDTSPAALQRLKADKVPDSVILAMVNAASAGPAPAAAATKTTRATDAVHLHIYRQRRAMNATFEPSIIVDDKQVARITNGSRFTIKLSPGPHTIKSDDNSSEISLDAKPGQEYFIRVDEAVGLLKGHGKLTMIPAEQGGPEYKLQKPLEDKHRIAKDMFEDDPPEK